MTVKSYVVYRPEDGRILWNVEIDEAYIEVADDKAFIEGQGDWNTQFVLQGRLTERPTFPIELSRTQLLHVPKGAIIEIEGKQYEADGSDIDLEFDVPGVYELKVSHWPYLDWTGTHEAIA